MINFIFGSLFGGTIAAFTVAICSVAKEDKDNKK